MAYAVSFFLIIVSGCEVLHQLWPPVLWGLASPVDADATKISPGSPILDRATPRGGDSDSLDGTAVRKAPTLAELGRLHAGHPSPGPGDPRVPPATDSTESARTVEWFPVPWLSPGFWWSGS